MATLITHSISDTLHNSKTLTVSWLSRFYPYMQIPDNNFVVTAYLYYEYALGKALLAMNYPSFNIKISKENETSYSTIESRSYTYTTNKSVVYRDGEVNITKYINSATGAFNELYFQFSNPAILDIETRLRNIKLEYICLPYRLKVLTNNASYTITNSDYENGVYIKITPNTGYKFIKWSDGNTDQTRFFNPSAPFQEEYILEAIVEPIKYDVNYYIKNPISKELQLFYTEKCEYDKTYSYIDIPIEQFGTIPKGYSICNGWVEEKYYNDSTNYNKSIRLEDSLLYYSSASNNYYDFNSHWYSAPLYDSSETFTNKTSQDNDVFNYYCDLFPIQNTIECRQFVEGTTSNYSIQTGYIVYDTGYLDLPSFSSPTEGYKLTNQMKKKNGPIDDSIYNSWFTDKNYLNPGDPKINRVNSLDLQDVVVYSYETPINYSIVFHAIDEFGNEINQETLNGIYGENYLRPSLLSEKDYNKIPGWYKTSQDTSLWYIDPETLQVVSPTNLTPDYDTVSYVGEQYTIIDQTIEHEYIYQIPYGYTIEYKWLDNWGPEEEFQFPIFIKKYGLGDVEILDIPSYENNYIVENANTKNWYYYNENGELQINNKVFIGSTDPTNYTFYGRKEPLSRIIKITPNNCLYGTVKPVSPAPEEWIQENNSFYTYVNEGDVVQVAAITNESNISYFSNWSDGITSALREITIGGLSKEYIADFRSNSIFINLMGVKAIYRNIELINPKIILGKQIN